MTHSPILRVYFLEEGEGSLFSFRVRKAEQDVLEIPGWIHHGVLGESILNVGLLQLSPLHLLLDAAEQLPHEFSEVDYLGVINFLQ